MARPLIAVTDSVFPSLDPAKAALARLEAQGLVYASFESRGEIAALVAEREARAPWPRDPDGAPLYPGRARPAEEASRVSSRGPLPKTPFFCAR